MKKQGVLGVAALAVTAMITVAIFIGCTKPGDSRTSHNPGEIGLFDWELAISPWEKVDRNEALELGQKLGLIGPAQRIISGDDRRLHYMQAHMDTIHQLVSPVFPGVPAPNLLLVEDNSINALVLFKPLCIPMLVEWQGSKAKAADIAITYKGAEIAPQGLSQLCSERESLSASERIEIFKRAAPFPESCVDFEEGIIVGLTVTLDEQCLKDHGHSRTMDKLKDHSSAGGIILTRPANWLVVSDMVATLSSEMQAALLAHELAHYYRSHGMSASQYNFFYALAEDLNPEEKPIPLAEGHPLTPLSRKILSGVFNGSFAGEDAALLEQFKQESIGFYTTEQEADELAIEYLLYMGLDGSDLVDTLFLRLKQESQTLGGGTLTPSYQDCLTAYEQGFPEFIGLGDMSDIHHSTCYRIYNVVRELKVHEPYYSRIRAGYPYPFYPR